MTKLCRWFGVARRTTYYKPTRAPAKVNAELAEPIKEMIEAEPSFGYRTVAALLGMNKHLNAIARGVHDKAGIDAAVQATIESADLKEGGAAWREKRQALFTGR